MHSQVRFCSQPRGTETQWYRVAVMPPLTCTQASPGAQTSHPATLAHSRGGTHGPQQLSRTLGTRPGAHSGSIARQFTCERSQSLAVMQRPITQLAFATPCAAQESWTHAASHPGISTPSG